MGKQFGLFLSERDEIELSEYLLKNFSAVFISDESADGFPVKKGLLSEKSFRRIIITHERFLSGIIWKNIDRPDTKYLVYSLNSNVIEYDSHYYLNDLNKITAGRMYSTNKFFKNGKFGKKDNEFIKFSEKLYRGVKKYLIAIKIDGTNTYFGKEEYQNYILDHERYGYF